MPIVLDIIFCKKKKNEKLLGLLHIVERTAIRRVPGHETTRGEEKHWIAELINRKITEAQNRR